MRRIDSFEKTLMLGKTEGKRRGGQQRMKLLDSITNSMDMKSHGVNLNLTQGKGRTIQQNPSQLQVCDFLALLGYLLKCKMLEEILVVLIKQMYSKGSLIGTC